jgi:hypothetical protein
MPCTHSTAGNLAGWRKHKLSAGFQNHRSARLYDEVTVRLLPYLLLWVSCRSADLYAPVEGVARWLLTYRAGDGQLESVRLEVYKQHDH